MLAGKAVPNTFFYSGCIVLQQLSCIGCVEALFLSDGVFRPDGI